MTDMTKERLHPRNTHRQLYDFEKLTKALPELGQFVKIAKSGRDSVDFTNPHVVKTLNKAILKADYDLLWDLEKGFLCPPIPGRADYIHYAADLIGISHGSKPLKVLDVGCGASCIYPFLGHRLYGWNFVGLDIHKNALDHAQNLIDQNKLNACIELRLQKHPEFIFKGMIKKGESFDLSLCNPPFHSSQSQVKLAKERKWKNLGKKTSALNFGGSSHELYCPGGELQFITTMIEESKEAPIRWITTLVSQKKHLESLLKLLELKKAAHVKVIPMGQGQKTSHLLAWSFIA